MYPQERFRTEDEIQFHAYFSSREWTFFSHLVLKKHLYFSQMKQMKNKFLLHCIKQKDFSTQNL